MMMKSDILKAWAARDQLYERRRGSLSVEDEAGIREYRKREIDLVPPDDRPALFREWKQWLPPER